VVAGVLVMMRHRFTRAELEAMSLEVLNRVTVSGPYPPAFYEVRLSYWKDFPPARLTFIKLFLYHQDGPDKAS